MKTIFKEEQKFNQWWIWILLSALSIIFMMGAFQQIVLGEPWGNKQMSDANMYVFVLFFLGINLLFWVMKLKTDITEEAISMHFFPFLKKTIPWSEISEAKVVDYGFVGGWGIRIWTRYGTVYNVRGRMGLAITLKNGKKMVIGTQQASFLSAALETVV